MREFRINYASPFETAATFLISLLNQVDCRTEKGTSRNNHKEKFSTKTVVIFVGESNRFFSQPLLTLFRRKEI